MNKIVHGQNCLNPAEPLSPVTDTSEPETFNSPEFIPEIEQVSETSQENETLSSTERLRREAWRFIQGECFQEDRINRDTVSVWLRTLLEQNSRLVETLNRFKVLQASGSPQSSSKRIPNSPEIDNFSDKSYQSEKKGPKCPYESKYKSSSLNNRSFFDFGRETETTGKKLQVEEELEVLRRENREIKEFSLSLEDQLQYLRDYADNMKNDIDCLLKISDKARDVGVWDPHGLNFCVVTFEQVFGNARDALKCTSQGMEKMSYPVAKSRSSVSSSDSRSSLSSEVAQLERRSLASLSKKEYSQVKSFRAEIVRLQEKCSSRLRDGVERDRIITDLQLHITELNDEMEEVKLENNANLSVIDKLKDDLHTARSRLMSACNLETIGLNSAKQHGSVSSLPEIPAYTSRFAKHLTRRSSQNLLILKISDELESANRLRDDLEDERLGLLDRIESLQSEKSLLQGNLVFVRRELEMFIVEHEKLKTDFRTLVRLHKLCQSADRPSTSGSSPGRLKRSFSYTNPGVSHRPDRTLIKTD